MTNPSITPFPELATWTGSLKRIASQPLEFCPDFPQIAKRFEAWWAHDAIDRPILVAEVNNNPACPPGKRVDLLFTPDQWFEKKLDDMKQLYRVGDSVPHIRVDFGPVLLGGMLGGTIEFGADTTWTHAFIDDDWSNVPDWKLRDDDKLWVLLQKLLRTVAKDAAGRYLVCTPDLGGSADVLLNLRGSQQLCMDAIEDPDRVKRNIDAIYPSWHRAFRELYAASLGNGAGVFHWLRLWSNVPYMVPACDFNFMIGPKEFESVCLPDIARQAATVGRAVFHLDGPGASRHIDSLLEVPEIQAIQYTPGTGTPSALAKVDMFRKIQKKGRSLIVYVQSSEVLAFCEALRPEGLAILLADSLPPRELDQLYAEFKRRFSMKVVTP